MSKEEKEIKNTDAAEKPKKTKKEKVKKEKRTFNKRKFKYGTLATAITVVFIAAVVLLNVLASQLTDRFGLKIDTTKEQLFEISDQTIDYLGTLEEDIEIAVMTDEETLDNGSKYYKLVKEVIEARNKMNSAGNINEELEASNNVTTALNKLFALSEAYPELKANENFLSLQKDLKETEDKLSYARYFYNDTVLNYNNLREQFPSNIIAKLFNFGKIEFFKTEDKEKEVPNVKF